jgi:hypothetical protein
MPNHTLHKNVYVEKMRPVVQQIITWQTNLTVSICMRIYRVSFPGVNLPECGIDHPPHLAPRLKKEYNCNSTWRWRSG